VGAACRAVAQSRETRAMHDASREAEWSKQREMAQQQRQQQLQTALEQQAAAIEAAKQQRKRELQKKLPANQELWREVAYLMTELTKLATEERQWKLAAESLTAQEAALAQHEEHAAARRRAAEATTATDTTTTTNDPSLAPVEQIVKVAETAADIALSVKRIQSALEIVSQTVVASEQARRDLYQAYTADHQFRGYQGVHDPKGLLRALSQSQAEEDANTEW
jgi:hypothetical protein